MRLHTRLPGTCAMPNDPHFYQTLPPDDQGAFADLDRIRIDMLNELSPPPAEELFAGERALGGPVLARLGFFRWILHELYGGSVWRWESSLERRDERLRARRGRARARRGAAPEGRARKPAAPAG